MLYWAQNNEALGDRHALLGDHARRLRRAARRCVRAAQLRLRRDQQPRAAARKLERRASTRARGVPASTAGPEQHPRGPGPLGRVRHRAAAPVVAVDEVDLDAAPASSSASSASRAAASRRCCSRSPSCSARRSPARSPSGRCCSRARTWSRSTDKELRHIRWRDFSVVMQSAMNALNPVLTIGAQMRDAMRGALDDVEAADRGPLGGGAAAGLRSTRCTCTSYPHQLSRRDAAAGDDRDGAAVHARADHHGRADVGPRRRRPSAR